MNNYDKQVIEEFEKKYQSFELGEPISAPQMELVKQFILSSLKTQREMFMNCVPEERYLHLTLKNKKFGVIQTWNDCRKEMLDNIKKI